MKKLSLLPLLLLMMIACKPRVPSEYIQPGEMEDILYDYHVLQAVAKEQRNGQAGEADRSKYFYAVLKKYEITEAEFDSSMVYYFKNMERLRDIYKEVNERLSDEAKTLGASVGDINRYSQYSASGDTANIWSEATDMLLMPYPAMNRFDFTIKVDTSFYQGDSFMFQFMSDYIYQSGARDAVVCILTKYEGDSTIQTVNHLSVAGISQVRVPTVKDKKLKSMSGFIYLNAGNKEDANSRRMLFISQLQLIRFHSKEKKDEKTSQANTTDSLERNNDARRPMPDSTRSGAPIRMDGRSAPASP